MSRPTVTVVIPAYNEGPTLERNLTRLFGYLDQNADKYQWEAIVVNDGSTDDTGQVAEAFAVSHPQVRVLHHLRNFRLGQALKYAFSNAHGDYVVTIDSDLSYSPDHIVTMLEALQTTHAKVVIASPYAKGGRITGVPRLRKLMSFLANRFLSRAAKGHLSTLTGMVRAYDRRFLQSLDLKAPDIEINTEIIYKAQLLRGLIIEVPAHLDWTALSEGPPRRSSIRYVRSITAYGFAGFLFRPFMFFILPGLFVLLLAAYTLIWSAIHVVEEFALLQGSLEFRISQAFANAYTAFPHGFIVGGLALVMATQLISLGLASAQAKRYFEELFHLGTTIHQRSLDATGPRVPLHQISETDSGLGRDHPSQRV